MQVFLFSGWPVEFPADKSDCPMDTLTRYFSQDHRPLQRKEDFTLADLIARWKEHPDCLDEDYKVMEACLELTWAHHAQHSCTYIPEA
jgi:hypothetical protein